MGKPVSSDAKRAETAALNTKVNKEVFDAFRDCLKEQGYSMNIVLETFMNQYANGRFKLEADDILKFKGDTSQVDTLNTTFNKEIYSKFKVVCKGNGFFVKHVVTAFMEKYTSRDFILEYVNIAEINKFKE